MRLNVLSEQENQTVEEMFVSSMNWLGETYAGEREPLRYSLNKKTITDRHGRPGVLYIAIFEPKPKAAEFSGDPADDWEDKFEKATPQIVVSFQIETISYTNLKITDPDHYVTWQSNLFNDHAPRSTKLRAKTEFTEQLMRMLSRWRWSLDTGKGW
jgi:hypothetical protein